LIEELVRVENFRFDLTGGSNRRTAWLVFHDAHFADKLSRADRAEKDEVAIEFSDYFDGTG